MSATTFFDCSLGDMYCKVCGQRSAVPIPAPLDVFLAATTKFNELHAGCEPGPKGTLTWWAYLHTNGTVQVKRYFSRQDIDEVHASPFVRKVYGPFEAAAHEARKIATENLTHA